MTTSNFFKLLSENPEKELLFEYKEGEFVPKAYHITEVKNVYFDSVDCGGNEHTERQTIVQLWVSPLEVKSNYMPSEKALKIMNQVDRIRPLHKDTEIFFEYGNGAIPTSSYAVQKVAVEDDKVILKMYAPPTACKISLTSQVKEVASSCCGTASQIRRDIAQPFYHISVKS